MLRNASTINDDAIEAIDGRIGTVKDFLFDDAGWVVRWLVVDTGNWLSGRRVLLPPSVLGQIDSGKKQFSIRLTLDQVCNSPEINTQFPVSRQMESQLYEHYEWSPYWRTDSYLYGYGDVIGPPDPSADRHDNLGALTGQGDVPHLRSIEAVLGYHIHARDGEIGHIDDFVIEDADWSIHFLIVDTRNWWPGKKVLISPQLARDIAWEAKLVNLVVERQMVRDSPAYNPLHRIDPTFEKCFNRHYQDLGPADRL